MSCWLPPMNQPQRCHINKFDMSNTWGKKKKRDPGEAECDWVLGRCGELSVERISTSPERIWGKPRNRIHESFLVVSCSFTDIARAEIGLPGRKTASLAQYQLEASGWHQGNTGTHPGLRTDSDLRLKAWFLTLPLFQVFLAHSMKVKSDDSKAKQARF